MRLHQYIKENIKSHLKERGVDLSNMQKYPVYVDVEENIATFPLFNLSGQFTGYQVYRPDGKKENRSKLSKEEMKYYTYATQEGKTKKISLYGLHTLDKRNYVFIVEGIFDAVKLIKQNQPTIAVLANHPKPLKSFFKALSKNVIAIEDNDAAGSKLRAVSNASYKVPNPYKDLGEMPNIEIKKFLKTIKGIKL